MRKVRPSNAENEADIQTLEKEIRALHWLARRKEQEWDQVRSRIKITVVFAGRNQTKPDTDPHLRDLGPDPKPAVKIALKFLKKVI